MGGWLAIIKLRSQELLNRFEFVMFITPYNPEQLENPTQLKIILINCYIPELNITICYLDLGDKANKFTINFPNCYNNLGQTNHLTQYLYKNIELSKYYFLIRQKAIPKVLANIIASGAWLPILYIPAPFVLFFIVIFVEDLLKKVGLSINSPLLILLLVIPPLLMYLYFVWQFDDLLKISNNTLSVRTGILKYTTIPLDKILNIEVQNQDSARNQDSYSLKLSYYDTLTKSIKGVIINPQWSRFNTSYILTGLDAAYFNYDKIYQ